MIAIQRKNKLNDRSTFDVIIFIILSLWGLIILYPFYNAILISFTPSEVYVKNPFALIPSTVNFDAYEFILQGKRLLIGYKTTLSILLLGLPLNIALTISAAYALSRGRFPGSRLFVFLIFFTMLFNGGVIPIYLNVKNLGLTDSIWSIILVYGMNTFYLVVTRSYFATIPESMVESAKIDGANDLYVLVKIMVPLAKPIIATILLFYAVDRWNEWYYSMLFLKKSDVAPLQLILRNIVNNSYSAMATGSSDSGKMQSYTEGIKMATIVLTMTPVMIVYPFVQKYFVKGILIGAVKG